MAAVTARTLAVADRVLGFPAATDIAFTPTSGLSAVLVNQLGDPEQAGRWPVHVKDLEREVIASASELFGGDPGRWWGYVTTGSSEGVLYGLWLGRERFPAGATVFASTAAHNCVRKAAAILGLPLAAVDTDRGGRIRLDRLAAAVTDAAAAHPGGAVLVVATVGTTMTEAVDDVAGIHGVLDEAGITRRHVVVDGALSGPVLALDGGPMAGLLAEPSPQHRVHRDGDGDGESGGAGSGAGARADVVVFSGHKFFGTTVPCGVVLAGREQVDRVGRGVELLGARDVTVAGSRSGLAVAQLWWALHGYGPDGHRLRAGRARAVAVRAVEQLAGIGWAAWRHPHAVTVVIDPPPDELARRWALPVADGLSHLVCVPGVTDSMVDQFVAELAATTNRTPRAGRS